MDSNVTFLRHYKRLDRQFNTPDDCYDYYLTEHTLEIKNKVQVKHDADSDSILGTYYRINPELQSPIYNKEFKCNEYDRKLITRYRSGSHELKIQKGRLSNTSRDSRLCSCENEIQTLHHVIFICPLTENIRAFHEIEETSLEEFFGNGDFSGVACVLKSIENIFL